MNKDDFTLLAGVIVLIIAILINYLKKKSGQVPVEDVVKKDETTKFMRKKKIEGEMTRGKIFMFFGSQSGTASKFCNILAEEGAEHNFDPSVEDLKDFKREFFTESSNLCIFCMATHGEGDPTDNAKEFFEWLSSLTDETALKNIRFTVFGLGNTQYEHYNSMGRLTNSHLERLGASRVYKYGEGDDNSSLEDDFNEWKENLWTELKKIVPETNENENLQMREETKKKSGGSFALVKTEKAEVNLESWKHDGKKYEFLSEGYLNGTIATVKSIKEIRQNTEDGSTIHMEIDLRNTHLKYKTAQNLGIYVENDPAFVDKLGNYMNLDLNERVEIIVDADKQEKFKYPFPSPIAIKTILTQFCDFQGQVMKKTLKDLSKITTNPEFKAKLERLASAGGKKEFEEEIFKKKRCLFDLLLEYQIVPSLEQFVELCPRINPRLFTISSSDVHDSDVVTVTDSLVSDKLENDRVKDGICSRYLTNIHNKLKSGITSNKIRIDFRNSSFVLPTNPKTPVIMIGPGTGIAPFIAFCQEKEALLEKGINIVPGEFTLYFGCKHRIGDYIFKEELQNYINKKILNHLYVAFSRDQDKKVYVQDLLLENKQEVYNTFFEREAVIYICGAISMGHSVIKSLQTIIQEVQGLSETEAHTIIETLEKDKRIIKELW